MDYRDYDTRLAAYALIVDEQDRILLALWNEGPEPLWTMPGGGVEYEETVEEGAIREVREETGYDVQLAGLLGIDSFVVGPELRPGLGGRALKSVRVVFRAGVVAGKLTNEVGGTTDEARWIPITDVAGLDRVPLVDVALGMWREVEG